MTIFDSIRYPISDDFLSKGWDQIPPKMFGAWLKIMEENNIQLVTSERRSFALTSMRKIIREWEDDDNF